MTSNQKKNAMLFLVLSIVITALFAASLSQLELKPGLPAPILGSYRIVVPEYAQSERLNLPILTFVLRLLGILSIIYLLVILFRVIMGMGVKKLPRILGEFTLIVGIFLLVIFSFLFLQKLPVRPAVPTPAATTAGTPLAIHTESVPPVLIWLVGISLAALAAILLFYWVRIHHRSSQGDQFTEQIEIAKQNILAGMNLDEVILRCYSEMGLILQQEGGIERKAFTTPTEFESELFTAGFPQQPVHDLTHLFESVRYGRLSPTQADEQEALSNLQIIITQLRKKKAGSDE